MRLSSIDPFDNIETHCEIIWSGLIDWCVCLQQITLFTKSFRLLKGDSENKMSQDSTEYHSNTSLTSAPARLLNSGHSLLTFDPDPCRLLDLDVPCSPKWLAAVVYLNTAYVSSGQCWRSEQSRFILKQSRLWSAVWAAFRGLFLLWPLADTFSSSSLSFCRRRWWFCKSESFLESLIKMALWGSTQHGWITAHNNTHSRLWRPKMHCWSL